MEVGNMRCDNCKSNDTYVKKHKHQYEIKGKVVEFILNRRFCRNCDSLVYDEILDNEASIEAIKI